MNEVKAIIHLIIARTYAKSLVKNLN